MDAKEIRTLMAALEKAPSDEKILEILKVLQKEVKPTERLLRETKVGVAVNKLKTGNHSEEVVNLVKHIIKHWKDEVTKEKTQQKHGTQGKKEHSGKPAATGGSTNEKFVSKSGLARNPKNDGISVLIYDNRDRNKSLEILYTTMALESDRPPAEVMKCVKGIEDVVYRGERGLGSNYRNKLRVLTTNLRGNPELRERLLAGKITPDKLYKMTPEEMAPAHLKKEIEEIKKKNLLDAQSAKPKNAITDRFTCGKCKQKKVSYYQMQTRSADEPLTTFCTCENCGNRWKFS